MSGGSIWEQLFLSTDVRALWTARRAEVEAQLARREHAASAEELRAELREVRLEAAELAHQVKMLRTLIAAMGEVLAEAKVVDPQAIQERFGAKIGKSVLPAPSPKVVRVKECPRCHANARGDADECPKCGAAIG